MIVDDRDRELDTGDEISEMTHFIEQIENTHDDRHVQYGPKQTQPYVVQSNGLHLE